MTGILNTLQSEMTSANTKKRKHEEENRAFNVEWEEDYAFTVHENKHLCLICHKSLGQNKGSMYVCMYLFIFILHSRESELYRYILDGTSALAWELPFSRFMGHLSST